MENFKNQKPQVISILDIFKNLEFKVITKFDKHPTLVFTWKTLYAILMKIIKALHHKLFEPQFDNNSHKKENGVFNQPNYTWQKKILFTMILLLFIQEFHIN